MTIIDALCVQLKLDSKPLDQAAPAAGKRLKDLEGQSTKTSAGVKKIGDTARQSTISVAELARAVGSFLAILGGTYALKAFVEDTIASNAALSRLSKNLGLSVSDISAWGNAVEALGGNAKGLQGTMSMLSQQQTELRLTGQSSLIPYFASLGVAIAGVGGQARPVDQILLDLSERFSHMDRQTANNIGHMMGIDQDTLNLLLQGRREVELTIKRQKEFNAVSKAQAEESAKLQKSMVQLKQSFTALGRDLLQQAAPAIEKLLSVFTSFSSWIQHNMEFIRDLGKVLAAIGVGLGAIAIATSPITLTVAAVMALASAIALLWQDYQTWKRGGDSFIDWEKWKPGIDAAKAAIKSLATVVKESFGAIFDDVGAVQKLINGDWKGAIKSARKSDDHVRNALSSAWHSGIIGGTVGVGIKAAPAERKAFSLANSQTVTSAYAMKYFQDRGMSAAEAAGLASQIHSESSGKANSVGDNGAAYGLIQWHADRQANFKKMFGHDIRNSTVDEQLAFMVHELTQGTERGAGNRLKGATSAEQAGRIASRYYVRPADAAGEALRRGSYAQMLAGISGASSTVAAAGAPASPSGPGNDNSVKVDIATLNVNTQATDAPGIARDITNSLQFAFAGQANSGLN